MCRYHLCFSMTQDFPIQTPLSLLCILNPSQAENCGPWNTDIFRRCKVLKILLLSRWQLTTSTCWQTSETAPDTSTQSSGAACQSPIFDLADWCSKGQGDGVRPPRPSSSANNVLMICRFSSSTCSVRCRATRPPWKSPAGMQAPSARSTSSLGT